MSNKKEISGILAPIIGLALNILKGQIEKIENEYAKTVAGNLLDTTSQVVDKLSDSDPNNKEQVKSVMAVELPKLINDLKTVLSSDITDDPKAQEAINFFGSGFAMSIGIMLDDNPDNKAQLKQLLDTVKNNIDLNDF